MTKEQKEFIKKVKRLDDEELAKCKFQELYVFDSGEQFEDINYNYITIVGVDENKDYILITDFSDVYDIKNTNDLLPLRTDIPRNLGCIRHFIGAKSFYFKLNYCMSSCSFEVVR